MRVMDQSVNVIFDTLLPKKNMYIYIQYTMYLDLCDDEITQYIHISWSCVDYAYR